MSNKEKPEIGSITWFDLTVPDAEKVKDFYSPDFVGIGWKAVPLSMGDYNDYNFELTRKRKDKRRYLSQAWRQSSASFTLADLHHSKKCS